MTVANTYWTLWLIVGFGAFEIYAVATGHPEWTFTHFYCRLFALFPTGKGEGAWRFRRFLGAAIGVWLVLHMLSMTMGGLF